MESEGDLAPFFGSDVEYRNAKHDWLNQSVQSGGTVGAVERSERGREADGEIKQPGSDPGVENDAGPWRSPTPGG